MSTSTLAGQDNEYQDYFRSGSLYELWKEGHPYVFRETYILMRKAFGYEAHYVNFRYWKEGPSTSEAGRQMTLLMGNALGLQAGERLLEGGSGLGQAAVDLCETFSLAQVQGMNPCEPQVRFANDLAKRRGIGDKVNHKVCDATVEITKFGPGSFDHGIAMECIGIFPDPAEYLKGLRKVLRSGGKVVFTVVTCPKPAGWLQHNVGSLFFGTRARPPAWWIQTLEAAGFTNIERHDITQQVFPPMLQTVKENLRNDPKLINISGPFAATAIRLLIQQAERGVANGTMGYEMFVAQAP